MTSGTKKNILVTLYFEAHSRCHGSLLFTHLAWPPKSTENNVPFVIQLTLSGVTTDTSSRLTFKSLHIHVHWVLQSWKDLRKNCAFGHSPQNMLPQPSRNLSPEAKGLWWTDPPEESLPFEFCRDTVRPTVTSSHSGPTNFRLGWIIDLGFFPLESAWSEIHRAAPSPFNGKVSL